MLSHLGNLLALIGEFSLDTEELGKSWELLLEKIESSIENKAEIQAVVQELKKEKARGMWEKKQATLKAAIEITEGFRKFSPDDPVRYDFSLTRFGIRDDMDMPKILKEISSMKPSGNQKKEKNAGG